MQELINKITSEVGLTAEQAQKTLETVINHVKSKLPSSLSGSIDSMFSGTQTTTPNATAVEEKGLQDKLKDIAEDAKDKLEDFADDAKDKLEDFADDAKEKLSQAADKAEDLAKDALGKLKGLFGGDK